jgi:signal transduction histidine kinase
MAESQLTAATGGASPAGASPGFSPGDSDGRLGMRNAGIGRAGIAVAGIILTGGIFAELAAPGPVMPLTGADFVVGACFAVTGGRIARGTASGWLALAVSAAWFCGTAATAVPALPGYAAGITSLGYRAVLAHLLLVTLGPVRSPRGAPAGKGMRLLIVAAYASVLLPVPADGLATAGLMAVVVVAAVIAARRAATDRRPVLATAALAAATLAVVWGLAASGAAGGNGLTLANDAALVAAAGAVAAGSVAHRWLPGAIHALVVDLGPSDHREQPVSGLLAAALADPEIEVRYAVPGRGWLDEQGRAVAPPPEEDTGPNGVTRAPAPGGGEVALIHGPASAAGAALSRAAAAAAALALENARLQAEARAQADAVRESRKRLLTVADEERQALAARLRAGPGTQLRVVDELLSTLGGAAAIGIRGYLADAVADLEQLALGLFPATLGGRPIAALVREIADGMPVAVEVSVDGPVDDLPPAVRALTYFFCAECLANLAKHAGASTAKVRVLRAGDRLTVTVSDDGRGGASLAGSRGLRGLADRVEVAGGEMEVVSPPGGPTHVTAQIPC